MHAGAKGFYRIGLIGKEDILITGPTNAGLADPGHSAAIALNQVSTTLWDLDPVFDNLVTMKVMHELTAEIGEAFIKAHRKLERDERAIQRPPVTRHPGKRPRHR